MVTKSIKFLFICGRFNNEDDIFENSETIKTFRFLKALKMEEEEYNRSVVDEISFLFCRFRTLERNFFETFHNLHSFNIANVDLETMQANMFRGAKNLTKLDISLNRLQEIPSHIFIDAVKLQDVDFSENLIMLVDPLAFEGLTKLQKLNLSFNQINDLDSRTFDLPNLLTLDLSTNNITKFDEKIFYKLTKLTTLNLSFNALDNLHASTFTNLSNLVELSLKHANLSDIQPGTFRNQNKLISLDLSENNFKRIVFKLLSPFLLNLQSLRLGKNQLSDLEGFPNATISPQMNFLDIQGNPFNCSYLLHFLESETLSWEKIQLYVESTLTDTHKSYLRGVSCDISTVKEHTNVTPTTV
ncbi:hypothetical protein HA402_011671 [Bradysia odoriphaga]|nr:hypothetical protein HA402_011671 [Bradysia odoriphaga]